MDEVFMTKLLESELLSEETKTEIKASVESFKTQLREQVEMQVMEEMSSKYLKDREELVDKIDTLISEALVSEVAELKSDIEKFRDLEAEFTQKIVEEKQMMAEKFQSDMDSLVDKIDSYLDMVISQEVEELKEDIEVVKQNKFGQMMYEAYAQTFAKSFSETDSTLGKVSKLESKLEEMEQKYSALQMEKDKMIREAKMEKLLSPLTGSKREQMEMILKNVETVKLDESYKFFIGRVLKEGDKQSLTEGAVDKKVTLITGNEVTEKQEPAKAINEEVSEWFKIAGVR